MVHSTSCILVQCWASGSGPTGCGQEAACPVVCFMTVEMNTAHSINCILTGQGQDPEVVNSTNDAGYTALHHAARHGSRELIEILLNANADRMIENNAGETPYMVAQRSQQYEAERLLLNVEQQHGMWVFPNRN